jgi:hypothetical protein
MIHGPLHNRGDDGHCTECGEVFPCETAQAIFDQVVGSNVAGRVPGQDETDPLERAEPYEPPEPPSIDGACDRCGYRGKVYPGRYGGHRCAVCFGFAARLDAEGLRAMGQPGITALGLLACVLVWVFVWRRRHRRPPLPGAGWRAVCIGLNHLREQRAMKRFKACLRC